jgi:hypothetical protein
VDYGLIRNAQFYIDTVYTREEWLTSNLHVPPLCWALCRSQFGFHSFDLAASRLCACFASLWSWTYQDLVSELNIVDRRPGGVHSALWSSFPTTGTSAEELSSPSRWGLLTQQCDHISPRKLRGFPECQHLIVSMFRYCSPYLCPRQAINPGTELLQTVMLLILD